MQFAAIVVNFIYIVKDRLWTSETGTIISYYSQVQVSGGRSGGRQLYTQAIWRTLGDVTVEQ